MKFTAQQIQKYYRNKSLIEQLINNFLMRNPSIVYGAKSRNASLPRYLKAQTTDYDIYTKNPYQLAKKLERKLERVFGNNNYFEVTPAKYPDTVKVRSKITENTLADFTKKPQKVSTIKRGGVKYTTQKYSVKQAKKTLKDPKSKFRHGKERAYLRRVKASKEEKTKDLFLGVPAKW